MGISEMIHFENFSYEYRPFPVGVCSPFLAPELYTELATSFPDPQKFPAFRYGENGRSIKHFLSAGTDNRQLYRFLKSHPSWRQIYRYFYSTAFIRQLLEHLEANNLEVTKVRPGGISYGINLLAPYLSATPFPLLERLAFKIPRKLGGISSKLEFSALPAEGGGLRPHTDSPGKIITLVMSFPTTGEWRDSYGGATSLVRPRQDNLYYNYYNRTLDFDDVIVEKEVPYRENQAMLFIKTFNSWHTVMPISAPEGRWRKTLTINIMVGN